MSPLIADARQRDLAAFAAGANDLSCACGVYLAGCAPGGAGQSSSAACLIAGVVHTIGVAVRRG